MPPFVDGVAQLDEAGDGVQVERRIVMNHEFFRIRLHSFISGVSGLTHWLRLQGRVPLSLAFCNACTSASASAWVANLPQIADWHTCQGRTGSIANDPAL